MTSAQIAVLVIIIVAIAVVAVLAVVTLRRRSLHKRFGPEYERLVEEEGNRLAAERELRDRERRHAELDLKPIDAEARERYVNRWRSVQEQFVSDPVEAVVAGDELVTSLVAERGYPTDDREAELAYLSVEHARTLDHYREAHEISQRGERGEASTEELRQALVHYREIFADVLGTEASAFVDTPAESSPRGDL